MKKFLLIATSMLMAVGASAFDLNPVRSDMVVGEKPGSLLRPHTDVQKAPVKRGPTADGFELAFCDEMYSWYYAAQQNKCTYQNFILINSDIATALAGNKVTDITFSATLSSASQKRNGSIFVAEISDEGYLEIVAEQNITITDSYQNKQTHDQTASFDEPYTIKENTPFCFGVIINGCVYSNLGGNVRADYPIGVDGQPANSFAGLVFLYSSAGEFMGGIDMAEDVGTNLYLKANTVGSKKDLENIFNIQGAMLGYFTLPVMVNGEDVNVIVGIDNFGTNALTSVTYTAQVGDAATVVTNTVDINIAAGESAAFKLPLPDLGTGKNNLTLTIDKVNGVATGASYNIPYLAMDNQGYDRKFVVEEATGTWCGWCPRGIVSFEYMQENYPETFTGIAVHADDDMQVESYMPYLSQVTSFPSCVINRDYIWDLDPEAEQLEFAYKNYWSTQRSPVKIDLSANYNAETNTLTATADTEFALSDNSGDFTLAFVLLQDNIPDIQNNYYSGGNYGECGGWESKGSQVAWFFNHVARDIFDYAGLEGSIPSSVVKGQKYSYTHELSLANVKDLKAGDEVITGITKTSVVALVLDKETGTILNAAQVDADNYGYSGINDATFAKNIVRASKGMIMISGEYSNATVYNVSGAKVATFGTGSVKVGAGLYIVNVDGVSHKVIVK